MFPAPICSSTLSGRRRQTRSRPFAYDERSMNLFVLGATGQTGRILAAQCLAR
jgi:hypothetical protein